MNLEPSGDQIHFESRNVKTIDNSLIKAGTTVEGQKFVGYRFTDLGAKNVTFINCDFSFGIFTRAYFRGSKFTECKFVGAWFYDCNFRSAEMNRCDFQYSQFRGTLIDTRQVLANLPSGPNISRQLLQVHRVNADSIGDVAAARTYIREEMIASREHYRRARERKEAYYYDKYKGWRNWFEIRWKSVALWMERAVWAGGEYPSVVLKSLLGVLLILTIIIAFQMRLFTSTSTLAEIGSGLLDSFKTTLVVFLGVPQTTQIPIHWTLAGVTIFARYVFIGLFASVLFRQLTKR